MPGLGALWDSLVDCICRPPRDEYSYPDELVGGSRKLFRVGRCPGVREDLTLVNKRGLRLQCSHYFPRHVRGKDGRLPCVLYCHCNSGSRRDAEEAICVLIPQGVSVFTLDFAGSGLSEGQWVTLGAEEVDDVACAVEHLRAGGRVSTLGLWGRSMGAVTALLYSQRDPSIAGMVLDSPFSRLTDLMLEIVQEQRLPIPRPLARLALAAMKRSVMKRAGFDITKVSPVDAVSQSFIPALFGHATEDSFIRITHAETLYAAYAGDKNLIRFDGDHNSRRPEFFYNSVSIFWHNTLQLEQLLEPEDLHHIMSPGPGAAAGAGAGTGGRPVATPRSLRPPPPSQMQARVRQPLCPLPAHPATASAAQTGRPASGEGYTRSSSGLEPAPGAPGASLQQSRDGSTGEWRDLEEDVSVPGRATRSAPWEPRLWETELDKTLLERQRFRRMAGGLPSPPSTSTASIAYLRGGKFQNSAELAHLLATASDDSVITRLLGEEPPSAANGSGGGTALRGNGAAAAGPMGAGTGLWAEGGMAPRGIAAGLWHPTSEEEEEAQLRAALQLSLLELAAAEATGSRPAEPGPGPVTDSAAAGLGQLSGLPAGAPAASSSRSPGQMALWQNEKQQLLLQMALEELQQGDGGPKAPDGAAAGSGAGAIAGTGPAGSGVSSGMQALFASPVRTAPERAGQPPAQQRAATGPVGMSTSPFPLPALGGRRLSYEGGLAPSTATALPTPALVALSGPQQPAEPSCSIATPMTRGSEGPSTPLGTAGAIAAATDVTGARASVNGTAGVPGGVGVGPLRASQNGWQGVGNAAIGGVGGGPSLYDLYSEEELLALALQLSLQESAAQAAVTGAGAGGMSASAASALL